MAIRATCGSCTSTFKAKDELAGKRVKCPKCKEPMVIGQKPKKRAPAPAAAARPKAKSQAIDPMEALLAEANVGATSQDGPICPDCAAFVSPGAVICVECGFNLDTGKKLRTSKDDDGTADSGMTDAEKIMQKAEAELEETPVGVDDQDFGDGGESFLIAGIAGVIMLILVVIGVVIILSMDQISQYVNSGAISLLASSLMWLGMMIWISYVGFRAKQAHGIACIATLGLYCPIFGFMQGKQMLMPTIIMLVALVVGGASGAYVYFNGIGPVST